MQQLRVLCERGLYPEAYAYYEHKRAQGWRLETIKGFRLVARLLCMQLRAPEAETLLGEMKQTMGQADCHVYNSLIAMYVQLGRPQCALRLCEEMRQTEHAKPTAYTYRTLIPHVEAQRAEEMLGEMARAGWVY